MVVQGGVFGVWYRVVGIVVGLWVFVDQGSCVVVLVGQMFEFGYVCVGVIVGMVDCVYCLGELLVCWCFDGYMIELQVVVGQVVEMVFEEGIDWFGVDYVFLWQYMYYVVVVGVQYYKDVGMGEYGFEEVCVVYLWYGLIGVGEVVVVVVGVCWYVGGDVGIQF